MQALLEVPPSDFDGPLNVNRILEQPQVAEEEIEGAGFVPQAHRDHAAPWSFLAGLKRAHSGR